MIRRALGWILVAFGIVGLGADVDDLRTGLTAQLGVGVVLVVGLFGGGALLLRGGARSPAHRRIGSPTAERESSAEERLIGMAVPPRV